jgi:hypothetical protein
MIGLRRRSILCLRHPGRIAPISAEGQPLKATMEGEVRRRGTRLTSKRPRRTWDEAPGPGCGPQGFCGSLALRQLLQDRYL